MKHSGRERRIFHCSFCGKHQDQVQRLIAGPGGVYICEECVDRLAKENAGQAEDHSITTPTKQPDKTNRCSFCGKKQNQVQHFNIGPGAVKICSECINLCQEIIDEESQLRYPPGTDVR